jgi:hypothetical protein
VLQENNLGSTSETFREMIETAGFAIVIVDGCAPQRTPDSRIYYIGIMRRGDAVPAWASGEGAERQTSLIASPSSSRATNRRRSSITEHSFHGIHASPAKGKSCYPCVRYDLSPMSRAAHLVRT